VDGLRLMYCDNWAVMYIASNPIFHERTKYIEVDYHFVRDAVSRKLISILFTPSFEELTHMFTKHVPSRVFSCLYNKLVMIDIYAPVIRVLNS